MPRMFHALLITIAVSISSQITAADSDVAVLYLERVFDESRIVEYRAVEMKTAAEGVSRFINELDAELERLEESIALYHPSQPQHQQQRERMEILKLRRKLFLEHNQPRLMQQEAELIKASYRELRAQLATFAEAQGLRLVLLNSSPTLASQRLRDLQLELAAYNVLYHAPELDITDAFLAHLDESLPPIPTAEAPAAPTAGPAAPPAISIPAEGE